MRAFNRRLICEVAPTNCPACHQKNNRISTPTRRHDHAPPQKGSGTCQANRRCDCFGAAMVIVVTSPLVIGVVTAVRLACLVFSCFQSGRAILWMAPSSLQGNVAVSPKSLASLSPRDLLWRRREKRCGMVGQNYLTTIQNLQ